MTFKLEAYDPEEALPQNARLDGTEDLVGHKILAVIEDCAGEKAREGEMMIVTETGCWIVLRPESGGYEDDPCQILVARERQIPSTETIHDYATASQMLSAGLIAKAQFDFLREQEKKREDEKKARRAAALRAELERLEGVK